MQAHGVEERVGDRCGRRWLAQRLLESGRRRNGCAPDGELGELGLVVLNENRSMLKQRSIDTPLRAPREFASLDGELAGGRFVEARRDAGCGRATRWSRRS